MKTRSWIALVAGVAACLAIAYGAYTLANYSWNQVVDYRGVYAEQTLPQSVAPKPSGEVYGGVAGRPPLTVYVVVDGLREDVSRTMPNLNNLRARGFDTVVRTSQPSLSFPNWTNLMSGAPQRISGVTTNWFEERVPVETLVDCALAASRTVVVAASKDYEMLYGAQRTGHTYLPEWDATKYMSGGIVDRAIALSGESSPSLVIILLPDIDEAGHAAGGGSQLYRDTALKVDADLGRIVTAFQGPSTTFVVAADHGHIDTGGHGGPEDVVTLVPAVFAGPNVRPGTAEGTQDQVAPTVALLNYLPAPRNATGGPFDLTAEGEDVTRFATQLDAAFTAYTGAVTGSAAKTDMALPSADTARTAFGDATDSRLVSERSSRLPVSLALLAGCVVAVVAVGLLSWRALVAALAGTAGYYLVYEGLFFLVRGYSWSLSSFNSESLLKAYLNGRMIDAVIAGIVAALVAADVYLALRAEPKRPKGEYLPGWLALGAATVLMIQATLVAQVAWYLWYWGASVSWYIPDLAMGFKYDLDLIQLTGLGAAALLAPVVTYLVGRFHPFRKRAGAAVTGEAV